MSGDASQKEKELYSKFKNAYEAHEKRVWEIEKIMARLSQAKKEGRKDPERERQREEASALVQKELDVIQRLVLEAKEALGSPKSFLGESVDANGLTSTIRKLIEREAIEKADLAFPYTFRTALLNAFLEREKQTRASIYKKHVRKGFGSSVESLIEEEQQKNEAYRKQLMDKYPDLLSPSDVELFSMAFKRRMARHGEEAV
ncbi:MAG: hypothetical protein Q7S09_00730 [bacterium]|nr:hypothetical protein [bacterium]